MARQRYPVATLLEMDRRLQDGIPRKVGDSKILDSFTINVNDQLISDLTRRDLFLSVPNQSFIN